MLCSTVIIGDATRISPEAPVPVLDQGSLLRVGLPMLPEPEIFGSKLNLLVGMVRIVAEIIDSNFESQNILVDPKFQRTHCFKIEGHCIQSTNLQRIEVSIDEYKPDLSHLVKSLRRKLRGLMP